MSLVVDASFVCNVLTGDVSDIDLAGVFRETHAPQLIDVEVTHYLRGMVRARRLTRKDAEQGRADLAALPIRRHPDRVLLDRAWELRDVCTTYDGLYVALAEGLKVPLVTQDARLARGITASPQTACEVQLGS